MSPELKQLQKRVEDLEAARNIDAVRNLLDFLIKDTPTVTDSDVATDISVTGGSGGTVTALDFPDKWIELRIQGKIYRIGAWLKENDSAR